MLEHFCSKVAAKSVCHLLEKNSYYKTILFELLILLNTFQWKKPHTRRKLRQWHSGSKQFCFYNYNMSSLRELSGQDIWLKWWYMRFSIFLSIWNWLKTKFLNPGSLQFCLAFLPQLKMQQENCFWLALGTELLLEGVTLLPIIIVVCLLVHTFLEINELYESNFP